MTMTREEFGIDLYDAIVCIGGLLAVQDQINAAVHRQLPYDEQVQMRGQLHKKLVPLMQGLPQSDVAEILRRYPFVATL